MSTFEWITVGTITVLVVVFAVGLWNHFRLVNREYRKTIKDMKDGGWL